jgi:hypothetical protein
MALQIGIRLGHVKRAVPRLPRLPQQIVPGGVDDPAIAVDSPGELPGGVVLEGARQRVAKK